MSRFSDVTIGRRAKISAEKRWQRSRLWALIRGMSAGLNSSVRRGGASLFLLSLAMPPLLLACGGGTPAATWPKGNVVFEDANNYTSVTSLTIPKVTTKAGADLMICWSSLQKDLLCHDITGPGMGNGIDNVGFAQIPNIPQSEVSRQLAVGQFDDNLARVYGDYHTDQAAAGATCAMLSQFKLGELVVPATDYVEPTGTMSITYMLVFTTGTTPTVGTKSMLFLEPSSTSDVTTVNAIDACAMNVLSFQATLGQDMPISATDSSKWHVDWSQLTKDSFGNAVLFNKIDKVLIGFYQGKTKADLQTNFKDIEISATTLYEVPVTPGARDVKLGDAKLRADGTTPFPGFSAQTDGVWAMAVTCSKCQVPAPVLMTILQPQ